MTLNTSVFVLDQIRPKDVYAKCGHDAYGPAQAVVLTDDVTVTLTDSSERVAKGANQ